jgi:ATP-dependent protease ClpP protease subunit
MSIVALYIDDVIGSEEINSKDIIRMLKEKNPSEIEMTINSGGGSVFEALAIYDYLKNSSAKVTVKVEGTAASAASFLMFAGDEKPVMSENAVIMIHNCHVPVVSMDRMNSEEIKEYIKGLQSDVDFMDKINKRMARIYDKINKRMARIYSEVTGLSVEQIQSMMDEETWLWAEEALEMGFVSGVTEGLAVAASASKEDLEDLGYTKVPANYVNQLNNVDMSENKEKSFLKHLMAFFKEEVKAEATEEVEETPEVEAEVEAEVKEEVKAEEEAEVSEEATEETVEEVSEEVTEEPKEEVDMEAIKAEMMAEIKAEIAGKDSELAELKKELDKAKASRKPLEAKEDVVNPEAKAVVADELGAQILNILKSYKS